MSTKMSMNSQCLSRRIILYTAMRDQRQGRSKENDMAPSSSLCWCSGVSRRSTTWRGARSFSGVCNTSDFLFKNSCIPSHISHSRSKFFRLFGVQGERLNFCAHFASGPPWSGLTKQRERILKVIEVEFFATNTTDQIPAIFWKFTVTQNSKNVLRWQTQLINFLLNCQTKNKFWQQKIKFLSNNLFWSLDHIVGFSVQRQRQRQNCLISHCML